MPSVLFFEGVAMAGVDSVSEPLNICIDAGPGASTEAPLFTELSPQESGQLVERELARGELSSDERSALFVCVASGMNGEQLAAVMPVLSPQEQLTLLDAVAEFSPPTTRNAFANHWDVANGTPKLSIKEHISTDVLWPTLTKFTPSEIHELFNPNAHTPDFAQRTAPALERSGANFTPLVQSKDVFERTLTSHVLVEPRYRAAGEHWAVEAGGVTAEMIETSGALGWWVPMQGPFAVGTLNYREKFGLAYANAEFRHQDVGTARASLSSGTQVFVWGTASLTPTEWDVGAFVGAEAVALKAAAQYQSPVLPFPGSLGLVKTQLSVFGDLNVGAAGGDIGIGARGRTDGSQFSVYGQIGFSPGVGWRLLPILDVEVDIEKADQLANEVAQEYINDPARQSLEASMASGAFTGSGIDPNQALGGLYLGAALRTLGPEVLRELRQIGRDLSDGLEMVTSDALRRWSAEGAAPGADPKP